MSLLEKNTYEPDTRDLLKSAWNQMWHALPVLAIFITGTALVIYSNGLWAVGTWIMLALCLITTAISVWAFYRVMVRHPFIEYEVQGVYVQFTSPEYYVPREKMAEFIEEMIMPFESVVGENKDPMTLVQGVNLIIQPDRPQDPLDRVEHERMVGLTYPGQKKTSYVYGPYALSSGGAGYELKLQACDILFPGRPEGEDIEWMRDKDLI